MSAASPWTDEWGIDRRYVDAFGVEQEVSDSAITALREAIGEPPAELERIAPVVVRRGASLRGVVGVRGPIDVECEDGSRRRIEDAVPADFPLGYHWIRPATGRGGEAGDGPDEGRLLIVSPGRCWLPEGWRAWGWTVQLYALRSESSWGFGDLGDLRTIRDWAQEAGAGFLLVNPLHAVAPTRPQEASPYLPASRRFRNPLYLRVADVPGTDLVDLGAADFQGRSLCDLPCIARDEVWRVKRAALQRIFTACGGGDGFARWRCQVGRPLEEFATWCALADEFGPDFHDWPADLHRPHNPAVTRYRDDHAAQIGFHAWLQWALEAQVRSATDGMTVLQDLPIGVAGGGADAWAYQDQLAEDVRIGAPPDIFNASGQDWGSPPLIPWRMRAANYEAFIAAVRATMAATGGLRIDHVMGLFRLWWLPVAGPPGEGAYVRYPSSDLLDIVALESHRAQAIVVGEDLGTVEPGVREALAEHGMLSYRLLWFEPSEPAHWPAQSMAAVTTHDLPTVAGLWSGRDLAEQLALAEANPSAEPGPAGNDNPGRTADPSTAAPVDDPGAKPPVGADLVAAAVDLRTRLTPSGIPDDATPEEAIRAAYDLLARSPATLLSATLEDAVAERRRPNMPGVVARANWMLPLPVRVEDLPGHPLATGIARTLAGAVNPVPTPNQGGPESNVSTRGHPDSGRSGTGTP